MQGSEADRAQEGRADGGWRFGGPKVLGRGFNIFKTLRRIFRALACFVASLIAMTNSAQAQNILLFRVRGLWDHGDPGRGFNPLKGLRQVFRAIVEPRAGRTLLEIAEGTERRVPRRRSRPIPLIASDLRGKPCESQTLLAAA